MAMNVGSPGRSSDMDVMIDINTTPLIDVMLVLLVMLIITIPIQLHSVNLNLPTGNPPPPLVLPEVVKLDIDDQSRVYWNGEVVDDRATLESKMSASAQEQVQPEVHLRPDKQAKYSVVAGVMARAVVVAFARRMRLEVARRVALDLGLIVDRAGELAAAGQGDREHAALEGLDRAGVLLAVLDPVVVGVLVARVHVGAELAAVVEAVTILVALGLLDLQRQVMSPLPAVRQLVVIAVTALGRGR